MLSDVDVEQSATWTTTSSSSSNFGVVNLPSSSFAIFHRLYSTQYDTGSITIERSVKVKR